MSWRDTLTGEELDAVEELKRLTTKDCTPKMLEDDTLFYRFMKARDFNLKNAEDMLRKSIACRKEYKLDTILTEYKPPEVLEKYAPITFIGFDKDGDIVKYLDLGRSDPKGVTSSAKKVDTMSFFLQQVEVDIKMLKQHSKKLGKTVNKIVTICNCEEFTFSKATNKKGLDVIITATNLYQDNYPEMIKRVYFLNGSIYFTLLYSIVKTFLAPALQEKVRVFGSDGYKESLLELIDADVLPAFLGGNRTDPDGNPKCKSIVMYGETVPEEYYLRKSERRLSTSPGVKKLTVTRFSKSEIRFEVKEPDSLLEWEFETKSRDIGFGVYFKDSSLEEDSKPVALVPKQRIDTCTEPEVGVYKCKRAGTYIVVFDNSYSWIYPKEIFYRARIIGPDDEDNSPWT